MNSGINEIARYTGFSATTVSQALRGNPRVAEGTRRRVLEVAAELGFLSGGAPQQKNHRVGVIMNRLSDSHHLGIVNSIEETLVARGYRVFWGLMRVEDEAGLYIDDFIKFGVDGLILVPMPQDNAILERLSELRRRGLAIVVAGLSNRFGFDSVRPVNKDDAAAVVKYLWGLGHRRIALIYAYNAPWRINGYKQALQELGVEFDPQLIVHHNFEHNTIAHLRHSLMETDNRPTAVFCQNDQMAAELIVDLTAHGYSVPADISIASVNDLDYAAWLTPSLTTLRLSRERFGQTLAEVLLERLANPDAPRKSVDFNAELIIRQSTAPPPQL